MVVVAVLGIAVLSMGAVGTANLASAAVPAQMPVTGVPASLAGHVGQQQSGNNSRTAKPIVSAPSSPSQVKVPPVAAPNVVLYDQLNNPGAQSTDTQQFEAANAAFNNQAADDFVVPGGQNWQVTEVDAQ